MEKVKKKKFKQELKKVFATGIVTAFSLIVALTWKDVITELFNKLIKVNLLNKKIISALIVTFLSAIGVYITTKILSD